MHHLLHSDTAPTVAANHACRISTVHHERKNETHLLLSSYSTTHLSPIHVLLARWDLLIT
jgi:hypothetical protein